MDKFLLIRKNIEYKRRKISDIIFSVIAIFVVVLFYFIVEFWVSISIVQQTSMCDTVFPNDKLITDRLATPKRGDVVVFKYDEDNDYIKRIIAVEGDVVYNDKEGRVFIENIDKNGKVCTKEIEEKYLKEGSKTYKNLSNNYVDDENSLFRVEVKQGELFVMGDNRLVSVDSRDFGVISINQIKGVVHEFWINNRYISNFLFRNV